MPRKPARLLPLLGIIIPVGLLASIAVPNVVRALHRKHQKQTMADIRSLATAMEARATDRNRYDFGPIIAGLPKGDPNRFETLQHVPYGELQQSLAPTYIHNVPQFDGWGTELDVRVSRDQQTYALRSAASDRRFEREPYKPGSDQSFEGDIVYSNGSFTRYPEGSCSQ